MSKNTIFFAAIFEKKIKNNFIRCFQFNLLNLSDRALILLQSSEINVTFNQWEITARHHIYPHPFFHKIIHLVTDLICLFIDYLSNCLFCSISIPNSIDKSCDKFHWFLVSKCRRIFNGRIVGVTLRFSCESRNCRRLYMLFISERRLHRIRNFA